MPDVELTRSEAVMCLTAIGLGRPCPACGQAWKEAVYAEPVSKNPLTGVTRWRITVGPERLLDHTRSCAYVRALERFKL